jgi:hypothetical protein
MRELLPGQDKGQRFDGSAHKIDESCQHVYITDQKKIKKTTKMSLALRTKKAHNKRFITSVQWANDGTIVTSSYNAKSWYVIDIYVTLSLNNVEKKKKKTSQVGGGFKDER